jgi:quinol monooxygenase YgiN
LGKPANLPEKDANMIIVTGLIRCDPAHVADYATEAAIVSAETRREPGNLQYALLADVSIEGQFVAIERWESEAALQGHLQTAHVARFAERTLSYLKGAEFSVFDAANERPLF